MPEDYDRTIDNFEDIPAYTDVRSKLNLVPKDWHTIAKRKRFSKELAQNDLYNFKLMNHDRVIDLKKFAKFVEATIPLADYTTSTSTTWYWHAATHKNILNKNCAWV
jgi:hypothetical protein